MKRWLLAIVGRVYVWMLTGDIVDEGIERAGGVAEPWPRAEVRRLVQREVAAIRESIEAHFDWQDREQRILSDRLARRFDLGQALNESANRAINQGAVPPPGYPTEKQKLALKLQEETLRQRLRDHLP